MGWLVEAVVRRASKSLVGYREEAQHVCLRTKRSQKPGLSLLLARAEGNGPYGTRRLQKSRCFPGCLRGVGSAVVIAGELENRQPATRFRDEGREKCRCVMVGVAPFIRMGKQTIWPHAVDNRGQFVEQRREGIDRCLIRDISAEAMMGGNPAQGKGAAQLARTALGELPGTSIVGASSRREVEEAGM